ncbi:MAG: sulfatase-like hydrolase/transferase, partial [Vicinamibacterales bacterium]
MLTLGGCQRAGPQDVDRQGPTSVLLITIDTLRADAVGRGRTPSIDRLAASGVRFDDARAHNVVTLPSHANILAGRHPQDHGVRDNSGYRFPPDRPTLATLLKDRGYSTGAFVSAFPLDSRFGLDRGFDVYEDSFVDARPGTAFMFQERRGGDTVALARQWMAAQGADPFFCWVHLYEPHFPYSPTYADDVAAADAALAPLVEPLVADGARGSMLVVLTSDHGESLGEHGEATHGIFGYDASLKVPLIFYHPRRWKPRVLAGPARHVDILPTLLEALSLPAPHGLPGRSLMKVMSGAAETDSAVTYFEALSGALNRGWAPLHGVVSHRMKYIDLPIPELYDLFSDPGEAHNLAGEQPVRVKELRALLKTFRAEGSQAARSAEAAGTRERLRSLGYAAAGSSPVKERSTEDDDPKRLIQLDAMLQEVESLYFAGDLDRAAARCRELIRRRPGMVISLMHLAQIERDRGDLSAAIEAMRSATALTPGDGETAALLGTYLTEAGRPRDAIVVLEPHARQDGADVQVLTAYSLALARRGRSADALAALGRAREPDPASARRLVETGTVRLIAGDRDGARRDFEAALATNPESARAHSSLGVLAAEDRHLSQAIEHWREAVRLDPREYRTVLGMGAALARAGRTVEARAYFDFLASSAPPPEYAREI